MASGQFSLGKLIVWLVLDTSAPACQFLFMVQISVLVRVVYPKTNSTPLVKMKSSTLMVAPYDHK